MTKKVLNMTRVSIKERDHALVIGSSLAGLFAARVLSDHYARVTILERDPVNDGPESRKGQPHTRHIHGLLVQGLEIIKHFFPGLEEQLIEGGAIVADMGEAMRWYHFDGFKIQFKSGLVGMVMSRPFLEWHIRRRVLDVPNVTLMPEHRVRGLAMTPDRTRLVGVKVTDREHPNETRICTADLVVDACGRGSSTPTWLRDVGYPSPPESEVKVRVGYATRLYRRRPDDLSGAASVMIFPTPPAGKHLTALFPVENERWIVTAIGWCGDYPPDDDPGFLAFIRRMPVPDIFDITSRAEPLSDIVTHRFPSNLRRHYEKLHRFPEGYLVIGDAVASFNPIYGQGMTSAAMQAQALDDVLRRRRGSHGLWRSFFRRVADIVNIPWQLAVGEDFRYPETEGRKPALMDLVNAYVAKVHVATQHDAVVYGQFLRVMNLMAPPISLMHPRIAWRVLRRRPGRVTKRFPGALTDSSAGSSATLAATPPRPARR